MKKLAACFVIASLLFTVACESSGVIELNYWYGDPNHSTLYETLDDVVEISDHIVYGELLEAETIDGYYTYHFQVKEQLKNETAEFIRIRLSSRERFEWNVNEYLLFLRKYDNEFIETTVHYPIIQPIPIVDGSATANPFEEWTLNELMREIRNSSKIDVYRDLNRTTEIIDEVDNIEALIELADYIVHIRTLQTSYANPVIRLAHSYEIITRYKETGTPLSSSQVLTLPSFIEDEQEYIILFRLFDPESDDSGITLATRRGSVIDKRDTASWEQVMNALEAVRE